MDKGHYKKYKKTGVCYYCDYCSCRKGHPCKVYKRIVKDKFYNSRKKYLLKKEILTCQIAT